NRFASFLRYGSVSLQQGLQRLLNGERPRDEFEELLQEQLSRARLPLPKVEAPLTAISIVPGQVHPMEEYERRIIELVMGFNGGSVKRTAAQLGIGRATLYRKLERFGLRASSPGRTSTRK